MPHRVGLTATEIFRLQKLSAEERELELEALRISQEQENEARFQEKLKRVAQIAEAKERARRGVRTKQARPRKRKQLTPSELRMKRIRTLVKKHFGNRRPDSDGYGRVLDQERIPPPSCCLKAGEKTYGDSLKQPKLRRAISAEISNL